MSLVWFMEQMVAYAKWHTKSECIQKKPQNICCYNLPVGQKSLKLIVQYKNA
jgi:hypothetical protein